MNLRFRLLILLFALLLAAPARAQEQTASLCPAPEKDEKVLRVEKVRIKGLSLLDSDRFRKVLTIHPTWKPWVKDPVYCPPDVQQGKKNIKNLLANEGLFEARVESDAEVNEKSRKVIVTYTVEEGKPTVVRTVDVNGVEELPGWLQEKIADMAVVLDKKRFQDTEYRAAKDKIAALLSENGYPYNDVDGTVLVFRSEYAADVVFDIHPGNFVRFGPISIDGLASTSPKLIYSKLSFKEGEPYSKPKVYDSQKDLFMMGPFSAVFIRPDPEDEKRIQAAPPEDGPFTLPFSVSGVYRKPREIKLGIGYGTEDELRGQVTWRNRNMGRYGQNMSVSAKASSLTQNLEARLAYPYFFSSKNEAEDALGFVRDDEASYINRSLYNKITLRRKLGGPYHLTLGQSLELDSPEELPAEDLDDYLENHRYLISTLAASVERDTRHPVFNPVKGSLVSFSIAGSPSFIGSEIRFMQMGAEARFYQPVTGPLLLAFRAAYEGIQPIEDTNSIPAFKRLYCGGANTVRGYSYQDLGPRDSQGNPLGGLTTYMATVELRFPIYKSIGGVLFSDAGAVLTDSFSFDTGAIRYTAGVGLRYDTPVGPLRIDVGHQLNPEHEGDTTTRYYFSIGQAF